MTFLSVPPPGSNVVSLKVSALKSKLYAKLNDHDVSVEFKLINNQAAAHVQRVRFQIYVRSSSPASSRGQWEFYRELTYNNQGQGWKLTPYKTMELTLRAFLNDEGQRFQVKRLLERRAAGRSFGTKHYGHIRLRILADVEKLAIAPQDVVDIYVDR